MNESGSKHPRRLWILVALIAVLTWIADEVWNGLLAFTVLLALVLAVLAPSQVDGTAPVATCVVVGVAGLIAVAVALFGLRAQKVVGAALVLLALVVEVVTAIVFLKK